MGEGHDVARPVDEDVVFRQERSAKHDGIADPANLWSKEFDAFLEAEELNLENAGVDEYADPAVSISLLFTCLSRSAAATLGSMKILDAPVSIRASPAKTCVSPSPSGKPTSR
jgi:hypothetical protein